LGYWTRAGTGERAWVTAAQVRAMVRAGGGGGEDSPSKTHGEDSGGKRSLLDD